MWRVASAIPKIWRKIRSKTFGAIRITQGHHQCYHLIEHMTSYLPFTETTHLSCTTFEIQQVISWKSKFFLHRVFDGVCDPTGISLTSGSRKVVTGLQCGTVCMVRFHIYHGLVTDGHGPTVYTALAYCSSVIKHSILMCNVFFVCNTQPQVSDTLLTWNTKFS